MRKDILKRRHERMLAKRTALVASAQNSNDANELRAINAQIEELNADIKDIADEIAEIEADEARAAQNAQGAQTVPAGATLQNASIRASYTTPAASGSQTRTGEHPLATMEYREAFRDFVINGTPIKRAGEAITTPDTAPAIPLTIMNRVINTVRKRYGNLYSKVLKTSMKGGVQYSIGALKATFKWINESTTSSRQKLDALAKIEFSYHTAEIRVAQSFLSQLLTIDDFETKIAEVIAIAYLEAMDKGIVSGSGVGQMTGILNDPRITKTVEMTAADLSDWTKWRKNFFAKLPLGYRSGEFIFPVSTVDAYLETMADANNNPIFRQATGLEVNDGDARNPNGRFFGRDISLVEPDVIPDFDAASAGDVIGIFWQPEEYAINENFGFTMRRYFDEETNEWVDKALVVVDGKVMNPEGFVLIKKKNS